MTVFVRHGVVAAVAMASTVLMLLQSSNAAPFPIPINDTRIVDIAYELAEAAFARVVTHNCYESYEPANCKDISDLTSKDVRLYYGGLLPGNESVVAVLPDNDVQLTGRPHDMFFVLDPFPAYKFGHPMFMFYVDFGVTVWRCEDIDGVFTGP